MQLKGFPDRHRSSSRGYLCGLDQNGRIYAGFSAADSIPDDFGDDVSGRNGGTTGWKPPFSSVRTRTRSGGFQFTSIRLERATDRNQSISREVSHDDGVATGAAQVGG